MFDGDRSTRSDPYNAIITAATREGGARVDIQAVFGYKQTLRHRKHCSCVVYIFFAFVGDRGKISYHCRAIITAATRECSARLFFSSVFV